MKKLKAIIKSTPFYRKNAKTKFSFASLKENKCIFFHIPRTGGISIANTLFGDNGAGHMTVKVAKDFFADDYYKFYKFSFVRNPYDKLISSYFYLKKGGFHQGDEDWVKGHLSEVTSFENFVLEWLSEDKFTERFHFQPQSYFLKDENGDIDLNFIGRYESIYTDFDVVRKELKIRTSLLRLNSSDKPSSVENHYSKEMKDKIYQLYKEDFLLFDYLK